MSNRELQNAMTPARTEAAESLAGVELSGTTWLDDRQAPPVDPRLLLRLVRQELAEDQVRAVYRLIFSFRSWSLAHDELLIAEFRRRQIETN